MDQILIVKRVIYVIVKLRKKKIHIHHLATVSVKCKLVGKSMSGPVCVTCRCSYTVWPLGQIGFKWEPGFGLISCGHHR